MKRKQNLVLALVFVLVLIAAAASWDAVKYQIFPKRFGTVAENRFYRSGYLHPVLVRDTLERYGIDVIVDLTGPDPDNPYQQAELSAAASLGIRHDKFPLRGDGTGNIDNYVDALTQIHESLQKNRTVLVHCAAGTQRTGGAVAFYRLLVEKKPPAAVYEEMKEYHWDDNRDAPLLPYVNEHLPYVARALVDRGIIDEVPDPLPHLESRIAL